MPTITRRKPRFFRPRRIWTFIHVPRGYVQADTQINVTVEPDDFSVIVDDDELKYADYFSTDTLVDENGTVLTDENGVVLVAPATNTGTVYSVDVPPDDFNVIVEEDTQ